MQKIVCALKLCEGPITWKYTILIFKIVSNSFNQLSFPGLLGKVSITRPIRANFGLLVLCVHLGNNVQTVRDVLESCNKIIVWHSLKLVTDCLQTYYQHIVNCCFCSIFPLLKLFVTVSNKMYSFSDRFGSDPSEIILFNL